jgi:polysaccharide lyase-like protein
VTTPPGIRGRFGRRALALVIVTGAVGVAGATPASAGIIKRLDFETGSLGQWSSVQAKPGRIDVVPSPVRQGRFASRFTVKPGDHPVPGGERAEVFWGSGERAGVTSWWRWSTYFPTGFHPNRGGWNIFTQWHHSGGSCTSPVRFQVQHGRHRSWLKLEVWGGQLYSNCEPQYKRAWTLGRLVRNRWYNFTVKFFWSPRPSRGLVVVRVNGQEKVHAHTATLYKGQGVYVKQGFYRGDSSKTTTIIHDGMQRFRP